MARSKKQGLILLLLLAAVPFTGFLGIKFFGDRKYYAVSFVIIFEAILAFGLKYEQKKPEAREIALVAGLCAIAVAARGAFFMAPQFKPVTAIIIITGICLGGETGFLAGAITGFASNILFGQGPWTPWQMFSFGIIGFLAGKLGQCGLLRKKKLPLGVFGAVSALVIYGGLMNPAAIIMFQESVSREMLIAAYVKGLPFDLVHSAATFIFLFFASEPMIEKIDRVTKKYGLFDAKNAEEEKSAKA